MQSYIKFLTLSHELQGRRYFQSVVSEIAPGIAQEHGLLADGSFEMRRHYAAGGFADGVWQTHALASEILRVGAGGGAYAGATYGQFGTFLRDGVQGPVAGCRECEHGAGVYQERETGVRHK